MPDEKYAEPEITFGRLVANLRNYARWESDAFIEDIWVDNHEHTGNKYLYIKLVNSSNPPIEFLIRKSKKRPGEPI